MKLRELADITGGRVSGDPEIEITGVSGINEAGEGDITLLSDRKYLEDVLNSHASAVIVREEPEGLRASMLVVDNPQLAFAKALEVLCRRPFRPAGVSERAFVGTNVSMGKDVSVHPFACISGNVTIGARVVIFPGVYIGEDVSIGDDSVVYANVTIRENVKIGRRVTVHAGAVIGADGFGYVFDRGVHRKIPQVGGVIIEDDVEIGANVAIDRATTGYTVVGSGTKIDNLVQIAHNVKIGKNCIIVAQTGISGSVEIGDGVVLGGQVGVRDHVKIGSGAMAGAQSGITADIPAGEVYSGTPAIPHRTWLRAQSIYGKLPEYLRRLRDLERKLNRV